MAPGARPKFRYAIKYLKEKFSEEGLLLAPSIEQPVYFTNGKVLTPPFHKDAYFRKNERFFLTGGPCLWISRTLHEKGPLTRKELWSLYESDETIDREDVPIKSSR